MHRLLHVGFGLIVLSSACGSEALRDDSRAQAGAVDDSGSACTAIRAAAPLPAQAEAVDCRGRQLKAASTITITSPDGAPMLPVLAASATGERLLALWSTGGWIENGTSLPQVVWAAALHSSPAVGSSEPIRLVADGHCPVATATATGFAVAWADAGGVQLQRLDFAGVPLEAATTLVSQVEPRACPTSLISIDSGLVLAWREGDTSVYERVLRVDDDSAMAPLTLDTARPTVSLDITLAALGGRTYAAYVRWDGDAPSSVVGAIDWQAGTLTETHATRGNLAAFFAADDRLVLGVLEERALHLYASPAGVQPSSWARSCDDSLAVAADACGRVVMLGHGVITPAGVAFGFFAQALAPAGAQLSFDAGVSDAALVRAGSGFGVLWTANIGPPLPTVGSGTLSFTTLSWR